MIGIKQMALSEIIKDLSTETNTTLRKSNSNWIKNLLDLYGYGNKVPLKKVFEWFHTKSNSSILTITDVS